MYLKLNVKLVFGHTGSNLSKEVVYMKTIIGLIISTTLVIGCAATEPNKSPVVNNTATESGDTIWKSSNFDGKVHIDKSFKFLGSRSRNNQRSIRTDYVFQKDDNIFLYIADWKHRRTWTFPKDNDGLLGKSGDPNNPALLAYEPFKYSVWKKTSEKSQKMLKEFGINMPNCYAAAEKNKMSSSRGSVVWVMYTEKTNCDYDNTEDVLERFNKNVSM